MNCIIRVPLRNSKDEEENEPVANRSRTPEVIGAAHTDVQVDLTTEVPGRVAELPADPTDA
jgi:hypothetical protein